MLAFRGHFLTKSPAYSTTFNAMSAVVVVERVTDADRGVDAADHTEASGNAVDDVTGKVWRESRGDVRNVIADHSRANVAVLLHGRAAYRVQKCPTEVRMARTEIFEEQLAAAGIVAGFWRRR